MSGAFLSKAQLDLFLRNRNRLKNSGKRLYAAQVHTLTLASLMRKGAITLEEDNAVIHETPFGAQLYSHTINREFISWREQILAAKQAKRA